MASASPALALPSAVVAHDALRHALGKLSLDHVLPQRRGLGVAGLHERTRADPPDSESSAHCRVDPGRNIESIRDVAVSINVRSCRV